VLEFCTLSLLRTLWITQKLHPVGHHTLLWQVCCLGRRSREILMHGRRSAAAAPQQHVASKMFSAAKASSVTLSTDVGS